jgi:aerobic carbon-monoxide dehydrogenase medium subunit
MLPFDVETPETLAAALDALDRYDDEACVFAGGTALVIAMRQRMIAPRVVVSLGRLSDLATIQFSPTEGLHIGALARHAEIARAQAVHSHYPVLSQLFSILANPQVRNQGTIGGNLVYADPATDPPSCLLALGADVIIAGRMGQRRLPLRSFLVDFFTTALEPGEILVGIRVPPPPRGARAFYRRHLRTPAEHRPVANVALTFQTEPEDGTWRDVRLVVGAAVPVARALETAAAALTGRAVTLATAREAASLAVEHLEPISDSRGDAAFRTTIVRAAVRRIVAEAAGLDWTEAA